MVDIAYTVLDSIAIFLVIVPMPWHISAWNTATCYMMIWTVLGCIIHLVNGIVWNNSIANPAPIYCDIATKILMGLSVAIPLSSLCINRRLYNIAHMTTVTIDRAQKRRNAIIDTLIAVLCPLIFMAVHYTQQGHRYDVMENYGCWPTTYPTALAYVFVITPPILVCTISLVYCTLTIRAFLKRRHEFNELLRSSSTGLTPHRYFRLMALATSEIVIGLPSSLYFLITNLTSVGVQPWISWEDTHWHFSNVLYWPEYFFRTNPALRAAFEFNRWSFPFIAFLFFAFFGLADEARSNYRRAFYAVMKPFGVVPKPTPSSGPNKSASDMKIVTPLAQRFPRRITHATLSQVDLPPLPPQYSCSQSDYEKPIPSDDLSARILTLSPLDRSFLEAESKLTGQPDSRSSSPSLHTRTDRDAIPSDSRSRNLYGREEV